MKKATREAERRLQIQSEVSSFVLRCGGVRTRPPVLWDAEAYLLFANNATGDVNEHLCPELFARDTGELIGNKELSSCFGKVNLLHLAGALK